jgi:hypothetical protein
MLTSIPTLLDITNRAKRHWNSISPTRQARMIQKYMERLKLLCAVDELYIPAFVGPDEMGDLVEDIETVQLISFRSLSRVIVSVLPTFIFESLAIFFGSSLM